MAISTIRRFTEEDAKRVEAAARRFAIRYGLKPDECLDRWCQPFDDYVSAVEYHVEQERVNPHGNKAMVRAWRRAFARALGERESAKLTVAYGYVGHYVE